MLIAAIGTPTMHLQCVLPLQLSRHDIPTDRASLNWYCSTMRGGGEIDSRFVLVSAAGNSIRHLQVFAFATEPS